MTAAVLYGKEDIKIEKVPIPRVGDGEVLVKVEVALTDGTDLKVFQRGYHARMIVPPALFGHELAGVIVEVGAGVKKFKNGMRVVALNSAPCGKCFYCSKHQENLCEDLLFNNGAYAEYIKIPSRIVETNMLEIPSDISFEAAAMTEPLACVLRGLHETHAEVGDTVAVIGGGPIGLSFIQVAKISGCNVIAVVKRDEQVDAAKKFGAHEIVQISKIDDPIRAVRALSPDHRGADVVIEAVGRPQGWQWAVDMVRKGGTVNFFGGCANGTKVELDTNLLHYSEITLKATFHHTPETVRKAFKLITEKKIKGTDYITGEAPLSRLQQVLRHMTNRTGDIKTAIIPGH
ncbi:MAG TPA: zinc-binding dehydrogenase [Terriglobales bacterium]|nr:zinc-binding dehydrogenase [Terriglobales bacterium]